MFDKVYLDSFPVKHVFCNRINDNTDVTNELLQFANVGINRGDDENAIKNRQQISQYFGVNNLIILNQIHSDIVHIITKENLQKYNSQNLTQAMQNTGDALITNVKNVLIGVNTADCTPILLYDSQKQYIAAIHAGWRGTIGNIIENTIFNLINLGCQSLVAVIGPCIHTRNLEINPENIPTQYQKEFILKVQNKYFFDMIGLVKFKLLQLGVKKIESVDICTYENDKYFSYRRSGGKLCGVQFSGLML